MLTSYGAIYAEFSAQRLIHSESSIHACCKFLCRDNSRLLVNPWERWGVGRKRGSQIGQCGHPSRPNPAHSFPHISSSFLMSLFLHSVHFVFLAYSHLLQMGFSLVAAQGCLRLASLLSAPPLPGGGPLGQRLNPDFTSHDMGMMAVPGVMENGLTPQDWPHKRLWSSGPSASLYNKPSSPWAATQPSLQRQQWEAASFTATSPPSRLLRTVGPRKCQTHLRGPPFSQPPST